VSLQGLWVSAPYAKIERHSGFNLRYVVSFRPTLLDVSCVSRKLFPDLPCWSEDTTGQRAQSIYEHLHTRKIIPPSGGQNDFLAKIRLGNPGGNFKITSKIIYRWRGLRVD
jgi:hypothetical protein